MATSTSVKRHLLNEHLAVLVCILADMGLGALGASFLGALGASFHSYAGIALTLMAALVLATGACSATNYKPRAEDFSAHILLYASAFFAWYMPFLGFHPMTGM